MIQFIKPYYGDQPFIDLVNDLAPYFPRGSFWVVPSGREGIDLLLTNVLDLRSDKKDFLISIPDVICGSVYEACKKHGKLVLMDCDDTWNCVPDPYYTLPDVVLYASLGGKRMEIIPKEFPKQIRIDDACQCYDGICGLRDAEFSIFSFGKGKQMFANGGGIVYGSNIQGNYAHKDVQPYQLILMKQQLDLIGEINEKRMHNARIMITELKYLDWLTLPDPTNHVFSKFTVFLNTVVPHHPTVRTPDLLNFYRHMINKGVECEFTYIPLHVRFPEAFPDKRYQDFYCNKLWPVALTLPCRPNLTEQELGMVIDAVRSFKI